MTKFYRKTRHPNLGTYQRKYDKNLLIKSPDCSLKNTVMTYKMRKLPRLKNQISDYIYG